MIKAQKPSKLLFNNFHIKIRPPVLRPIDRTFLSFLFISVPFLGVSFSLLLCVPTLCNNIQKQFIFNVNVNEEKGNGCSFMACFVFAVMFSWQTKITHF